MRGADGRRGSVLDRIRPEERLALVYVAGVGLLLAAHGIPFSLGPLLVQYAKFVGAIAATALPVWLAVRLARAARGGFDRRAAAADLLELLRSLAVLLALLVAYTNLKSRIFDLNPRSFDHPLRALDAFLHAAGGDFVGWVISLRPDAVWTGRWERVYFLAWAALALPFAVAFARRGGAAARRIATALGLVYAAGSLLYLALPSLGPAFAFRDRFLTYSNTTTFAVQEAMLDSLRLLLDRPQTRALPFFGIAAFPSLHLATTSIGLLAAGRWAKPLLVLLVPWNLAIAFAALLLGWHYAIDFYPGVVLAWGAWWCAGRLVADAEPAAAAAP
jgi:hypothetical protein